jgi:hypothetical protein
LRRLGTFQEQLNYEATDDHRHPALCARVAHVSSPAPAAAKHLEAITSEADLRALGVVSVDPDIGELPRWHLRSSAAAVQRRLGLPVLLRVGGRSVPEVIG